MAVLDIRGTNGAGKSHIVHRLLAEYSGQQVVKAGKVIGYWMPSISWSVLGTYENQCGGCDSIKTANEICDRARLFYGRYSNVILEGITVSHTYKRYNDLALELGNYRFLFLTTPLEICIHRVKQRRVAKGNLKVFNPHKNLGLASDYDRVLAAKRNLLAAGRDVIDLNWRSPTSQVMKYLTDDQPSA